MKYCDYMETCAQSLVQAAVAETDSLLPYFIRLQRLAEEIEHAFDYGQNEKLPPLDTLRIELLLKSFEQQLSQFEVTFPQHVWNNCKTSVSPNLILATDRPYSLYNAKVLLLARIHQ